MSSKNNFTRRGNVINTKPFDVSSKTIEELRKEAIDTLAKYYNMTCTEEELESLKAVTDPAMVEIWYRERAALELLRDGAGSLDEIDLIKNIKDPLDITVEDLDTMVDTVDEEMIKSATLEAINRVRAYLSTYLSDKYVVQRGIKRPDGSFDFSLEPEEAARLDAQVNDIINKNDAIRQHLNNNGQFASVTNSLNDQTLGSRYDYDKFKMGVVNDFGVTPESFDEFFKAVKADNESRLNEQGYEQRTALQKNLKPLYAKYKHLLKHFDDFVPGSGKIYWTSPIVEKIDEQDARDVEEYKKKDSEEFRTYQLMKGLWTDPRKPISRDNTRGVEKKAAASYIQRRKEAKLNKFKDDKVIEDTNTSDITKPIQEEELVIVSSDLSKYIDEVVDNPIDTRPEETTITSTEINIRDTSEMPLRPSKIENKAILSEETINKSSEDENTRKIDFTASERIVASTDDIDIASLKVETPVVIEETIVEDKKDNRYIPKDVTPQSIPIEPRGIDNHHKLVEEVARTRYEVPDLKEFRNINDPVLRLSLYRHADRRGRELYLPNSNYVVFIKKIRDKTQISYMLNLIDRNTDAETADVFVKNELIRILYENLEFPFAQHVSLHDFMANLHDSDISLLMIMFALVNIPEDDNGKVPLEVTSLICNSDDNVAWLKNPKNIDLKEEFGRIYPKDLFSANYNKYHIANYQSIYDAYRRSEVGKPVKFIASDDVTIFEVIASRPTVYKTQNIRTNVREVTYKLVAESIKDNETVLRSSNDPLADVILSYVTNKSFNEYQHDIGRLGASEDESLNSQDKELKEVLEYIEKTHEARLTVSNAFFVIAELIDYVECKTLDTNELISKVDHSNLYNLARLIEMFPEDMISQLIKFSGEVMEWDGVKTDILFNASDVEGELDFDKYYGTDEETIEFLKERKIPQERIDYELEQRAHWRENQDKGLCICGNDTWKINYTQILFFYTSSQLQATVK